MADRGGCSPAIVVNNASGMLAESVGKGRLIQAAGNERGQGFTVGDHPGGIGSQQFSHFCAEVASVRSEADGRSVGRRLQHVLAPATTVKAAADEGDSCHSPPNGEFTGDIDQ